MNESRQEEGNKRARGMFVLPAIPQTDGLAFVRELQVMPGGTFVRYNPARYEYPRIRRSTPTSETFDTEFGSLPFDPAARLANGDERFLNANVWKNYVAPLMGAAHGYAESMVGLALQPARAELVTTGDGDFLSLGVRLWNLWPSSEPNALTWQIDQIQVTGVRTKDRLNTYAPNTLLDVPGTYTLAPGGHLETDKTQITWPQRTALTLDSHAAVLVTAHVGSGNTRTPLVFSVPIPNAVTQVKQTAGEDQTAAYTNATPNCYENPMGCYFDAELGLYKNPLRQRVTGEIKLLPSEVDITGREADPTLKQAQKNDARISEVILFAWPRSTVYQQFHPVKANNSNLTLNGSNLTRVGPGHWVRPQDAPDDADGPITFDAQLNLLDFYQPDIGEELADATRASGTVYIGVMTTAGTFQAERLLMWPLRSPRSAAEITQPISCDTQTFPHEGLLAEDRGVCHVTSGPNNTCQYRQWRAQVIVGDAGLSAVQLPMTGNPITVAMPLLRSAYVRAETFMGRTIPLSGDAFLPMYCDQAGLNAVYPMGSGVAYCDILGPTGLSYWASEYTPETTGNMCPDMRGLGGVPRATYRWHLFPGFRDELRDLYGINTPPAEWTFEIR